MIKSSEYHHAFGRTSSFCLECSDEFDKLGSIKGRFIVSLNNRPEVREVFSSFRICEVPLTYTIAGGEGKSVSEVIIMDHKEPSVINLP